MRRAAEAEHVKRWHRDRRARRRAKAPKVPENEKYSNADDIPKSVGSQGKQGTEMDKNDTGKKEKEEVEIDCRDDDDDDEDDGARPRPVPWLLPVREGRMDGLFALRGGGVFRFEKTPEFASTLNGCIDEVTEGGVADSRDADQRKSDDKQRPEGDPSKGKNQGWQQQEGARGNALEDSDSNQGKKEGDAIAHTTPNDQPSRGRKASDRVDQRTSNKDSASSSSSNNNNNNKDRSINNRNNRKKEQRRRRKVDEMHNAAANFGGK